ncbi:MULTISPECIES: DNA/RNA nuclease SfsA [Bacillota]|uniref:Sugar fermentation stimulation protein A n=1 Tax=Anaerotignum neopropionicum TaxID=36847 RepID=A0A136WGH4_9FIRM|nr:MULTISPECIES: DNA/RNA nuclease SfsA [Bacillota]KXL53614.1 sugar fermentation stimulation protein A [Anaerotignum neopropionicum]WSI03065.1 DNA/RNA nuclease SfsA [Sedimentibacter sp. MB36-C1]
MRGQYHKAIFLEEGKYRFLCTIIKEELREECYVSSSSKLSKYLSLENCKVLVSENKGNKLRTRYTLEAVECEGILYYVNFNRVNQLYEKYLLTNKIAKESIYREYTVDNMVKTDFFMESYGCIEVKSLLSSTSKIIYPDNASSRLERQLIKYIELLKRGTNVTFAFVSMSPSILDFEWQNVKEVVKLHFCKAVLLGLKIKAFSVVYEDNEFRITENMVLEQNIIKTMLF